MYKIESKDVHMHYGDFHALKGINIAIKPWVSIHDFPSVPGELYQALVETFREQRIQMPFPQREIRILNYDRSVNHPLRSIQDRAATGI